MIGVPCEHFVKRRVFSGVWMYGEIAHLYFCVLLWFCCDFKERAVVLCV